MSLPTKDAAGWVLGDAHTTPEEMYSALLEMIDAADVVRPLAPFCEERGVPLGSPNPAYTAGQACDTRPCGRYKLRRC